MINNISASFKYKEGEQGFLLASSKDFNLDIAIDMHDDILHATIQNFKDTKRDINAKGDLFFDGELLKLYTAIDIKIKDELSLTFFGLLDPNRSYYKVRSKKKIKDYKYTIGLADLPDSIMVWAYDGLDMSDVDLINASGYVDHNNIADAYKNLHIKADVNNLDYTYNTKLDTIHTSKTELEFKDGILFIRPKKASSYNIPLKDSWLKVDFTKKEVLLTLFLLFDAKLNKDVLSILEAYDIKLPFLQKSGTVKTNLKIEIALENIDIDAQGEFYTKEAKFNYLGLDIDIFDATIKLDNYDVSIKNMFAKYKDMAAADVKVSYDAAKSIGNIDFNFKSLKLDGIKYDFKAKPLLANYTISPGKDTITVQESHWIYKDQILTIDELCMPFNIETLKLSIPTTFVSIEKIGTAFIAGSVDVENFSADMKVDILKFSYDGVELTQSNTPLKIKYDKELTISSDNEIFFSVSGSKYKVKDLFVNINKDFIKIKHINLEIGKYIKTKVYAKFTFKTQTSHISLSNFTLTDPNTDEIIYKNNKILISASILNDTIKMKSKELNAVFTSQSTGWRLYLNSLGRIAKGSKLLKKYQVEKGTFTLYRNRNDKYTRFNSTLIHPYKILVKNNKPISKYLIKGKIYHEKVYIDINNKVDIIIKDDIKVTFNNSAINLLEIIKAYKSISTEKESKGGLNIFLDATNSYFYLSDKRQIIYDTFKMQFYNNILSAQMQYKKGTAGFKYENSEFHLYGKNFNDNFMYKLFSLSKFDKGSLDFSMNGNINDYKGLIYVHDSTIKDYKALNNILAFVNTVPSLVTFSVPGYSKNGLFVKKSYLNFTFKNSIFNFTDIYLHSKEMDIVGKGVVDTQKENMDITLNLKTDLGSELSKVPLVGYILLDGETISTSLKITGAVNNPEVHSLIAKDITVAPLNIIMRTLTLPYKLIKDATAKEN